MALNTFQVDEDTQGSLHLVAVVLLCVGKQTQHQLAVTAHRRQMTAE